ncbi:MBL fold metallo-hydrolase [Marinicella rhabdoformis]|uniref:MBL fold metallo-hydrolase n=1 Tax=Marinicella rhabdoformis TaxID=2580566 RepID=UPI0012AEB4C0|nr:MBL fold metallo-hydrolase [Marinicella rhabdoformis]
MKRTILITAVLSTLTFNGMAKEPKTEEKPPVEVATTEVVPGIYMLSGVNGFIGGNIGLLTGEDATILIDDAMPPFLDKLKNAVQNVAGKPIDFLVNTHVHGDHTGNNEALGKGHEHGKTHIVAHENLRHHMITKGVQGPEGMVPAPESALPVMTFSDQMTFHFNKQPATVFHVPKAHTDGDAVIHFSEANVIHTGDTFFNGLFPYVDLDSGGSVDGYIHAQLKVISMANDETKIIPGHGPLADKADLQKAVDMLIDSKQLIQKAINDGQNLDQILKANPLQKYHDDWNWGFISTERMATQLFNDLSHQKAHASGDGHQH